MKQGNLQWIQIAAAAVASLALLMISAMAWSGPGGNGKGKGNGGGGGTGSTYQPDLRTKWRAPLDGRYSLVRPVVNPVDGAVYVVDVADNLYAFSADSSAAGEPQLLWQAVNAGSKGVDVSRDGSTVYTGNENWIKAYNAADGSLKWTFMQSPRAFILIDVAVAPDGSVCAVASSGMGIFCLADGGQDTVSVRWQNPEAYSRIIVSYTELGFGPGDSNYQLYFAANGHTRSVRVSDGSDVFTTGYAGRPVVSQFDGTWHRADSAFNPDGGLYWRFDGFPTATGGITPSIGSDGVHYTVNQGFRVFAIGPSGFERWQQEFDEGFGIPDVSPGDDLLMLPTGSFNSPAAIRAIGTANGADRWRGELPAPSGDTTMAVDAGMAFSANGDTVYVLGRGQSADPAFNRVYLYALDTDPAIPNASTLMRSAEVSLVGRRKGRTISFTGIVKVVDENRAGVPGATVTATWHLPDGSQDTQTATSGGNGEAKFSVSDGGGIYTLSVNDITNDPYVFDALHSNLSGSRALF